MLVVIMRIIRMRITKGICFMERSFSASTLLELNILCKIAVQNSKQKNAANKKQWRSLIYSNVSVTIFFFVGGGGGNNSLAYRYKTNRRWIKYIQAQNIVKKSFNELEYLHVGLMLCISFFLPMTSCPPSPQPLQFNLHGWLGVKRNDLSHFSITAINRFHFKIFVVICFAA